MTKSEREVREYKSLYADERYAKQAWKKLMDRALQGDGKPLPESYDKDGKVSFNSNLDFMAYQNVKARLEADGLDREPQQAELIIECNILRARFADTTFNILLDRTAGKVKDEINLVANNFEELSDEELELLAAHRKSTENKQDK